MTELRNCPFCGSKQYIKMEDSFFATCFNEFSVNCSGCYTTGPLEPTKEAAVKAWNTRAADKPTTSNSIAYESTTPHARLILDEE